MRTDTNFGQQTRFIPKANERNHIEPAMGSMAFVARAALPDSDLAKAAGAAVDAMRTTMQLIDAVEAEYQAKRPKTGRPKDAPGQQALFPEGQKPDEAATEAAAPPAGEVDSPLPPHDEATGEVIEDADETDSQSESIDALGAMGG